MISIRKSVNALERLEQLRQLCQSGYVNAIRAAADYAIELDPAHAAEFRQNLGRIREQLESAAEEEDYQAIQSSLRGELRLYRDRSAEWLERVAEELRASAVAMQTLAGNLASNGDDHEANLQASLRSLEQVQQSEDLLFIKRVTHEATVSISESWEQLRRANQLVTAQLHDEIRSLHREIDAERRALFTDAVSGAWNREKLLARIEDNLRGPEVFCVVMIAVGNLKRLGASYSRPVIDGALKALVKRVHGIVGSDAMIGRWGEDQFAVLVELDPAYAMNLASEIGRDLSSPFSIQENGAARSFSLRVSTSVIARPLRGDPAHFREKLAALEGMQRP